MFSDNFLVWGMSLKYRFLPELWRSWLALSEKTDVKKLRGFVDVGSGLNE